MFVMRSPDQQFQQDRSKSDSLGRQAIMDAPAVARYRLRRQNASGSEFVKAVRENVGGNSLSRALEFMETPVSAHHQVTDDQQRPAVAEQVQ